jgi:hypothetical protein
MRKRLLILFLAKPREKVTAILKTYELFVYGDIKYICNPLCKICYKKLQPSLDFEFYFYKYFPLSSVEKYTDVTIVIYIACFFIP